MKINLSDLRFIEFSGKQVVGKVEAIADGGQKIYDYVTWTGSMKGTITAYIKAYLTGDLRDAEIIGTATTVTQSVLTERQMLDAELQLGIAKLADKKAEGYLRAEVFDELSGNAQ